MSSTQVVTDLPEPATSVLDTRAKELDLLNSVLCADYLKEEEAEEKALTKAAKDDLRAPPPAKRTQVSLAKISGGDAGVRYLDFGKGGAPQAKAKRHKLFKSRPGAKR